APTEAPAPLLPTVTPTLLPSFRPSTTQRPTTIPSFEPTNFPTSSHRPTAVPTKSSEPSNSPSTSNPTLDPTPLPTLSPVFAPSNSPSTNGTLLVKRGCNQILEVKAPAEFDPVETGIYKLLMQSYTVEFGEMVGEPQIVTTCEVTGQNLADGRRWLTRFLGPFQSLFNRRLQTPVTKYLLVMEFTMEYESRFGIDVDDYPREFQSYINNNLEKITADMTQRFLPVTNAREVIVFNTAPPTSSPILSGTPPPSPSPTLQPAPQETSLPTVSPSAPLIPTLEPTYLMLPTPSPTNQPVEEPETNFIVGLAAGLGGAAIVVLFLIWYMRKKNQQKQEERRAEANDARGNHPDSSRIEEGIEVGVEDPLPGVTTSSVHGVQQYDDYPPEDNLGSSSPQGGVGTIADSIFSNPSMVSGGGSFSSNPDDNYDVVRLDTLQDEFDSYKNQDMEYMRSGVEDAVYGAEGMMSLAMTRALMEDEDAIIPSWGGAEDPESIEANGLCETNDWLRKNEHSTLDERNLFFQEMLNRMVITVRRGMISPSDGTRAIHCMASMLGLQLEKDLPNNVLLVYGMKKENDFILGRNNMVEAFKSFGDIEGAAIAPSNRGFGFVRFVSPKSVQRALERFRISEIEVQDVSVMIKSLNSDL
ncbi:hypothetical protein ACHAXR_002976, partial [Thalassiosira sp. AJA248-18]